MENQHQKDSCFANFLFFKQRRHFKGRAILPAIKKILTQFFNFIHFWRSKLHFALFCGNAHFRKLSCQIDSLTRWSIIVDIAQIWIALFLATLLKCQHMIQKENFTTLKFGSKFLVSPTNQYWIERYSKLVAIYVFLKNLFFKRGGHNS